MSARPLEAGRLQAGAGSAPESLQRALEWYRRAAEAGVSAAQLRMSNFFAKADVVSRDLDIARSWYERATSTGHPAAKDRLRNLRPHDHHSIAPSMHVPILRLARTVKQYQFGKYEAALLDQIEVEGSMRYQNIVPVFRNGEADPFLIISSERSGSADDQEFLVEMGSEVPEKPETTYFLCMFDARGHFYMGESLDCAHLGTFEAATMKLLQDRLGVRP